MSWNPPPTTQPSHPSHWSREDTRPPPPSAAAADYPPPERIARFLDTLPQQGSNPPRLLPPRPPPPPPEHSPQEPPQDMSVHSFSSTPEQMYRITTPQTLDQYRVPPHQMTGFQQPAPRQRTAIACRYCRRRKIRCSGFETSADGRCANCLRFNQECVFTPVSSQTQAFVPAHAAYPQLMQQQKAARGGRIMQPVLYGAHGQPLPHDYSQSLEYHSSYQRTQPSPPPPPPPPPPPGPIGQPPPSARYGPSSYDEQMAYEAERSRRGQDQHPPVLPPPVPAGSSSQPYPLQRRSSAGEYQGHYGRNDPPSPSSHLPPPHHAYSPPPITGSSSSHQAISYGQGPVSSAVGGYYPQSSGPSPSTQQRPRSPISYHSPGERPSVSPHPFHPPMQYQPPPPARPTSTGPGQGPSSHPIPSMQMANLIDPSQSHPQHRNLRSAADGDMLSRLMPRKGL